MACCESSGGSGKRKRRFNGRSDCDDDIFRKPGGKIKVLKGLDLAWKTIAITGTTTGIGTETAKSLALAGAHLILLNRSHELSEKQKAEILARRPDARVDFVQCDLSSLASVRAAAEGVIDLNPLHVLVLNAGVFASTQKETSDGLEPTFGVNHVAHFLLTSLLLPLLRSSSPSRVVVVSSEGHSTSGLTPSRLTEEKVTALMPPSTTTTNSFTLYCLSKLCNVLFAKKLHRSEHANGIDVYVLHPGAFINTGLSRGLGFWGRALNAIASPFTKNLSQGAATSVYCAAHPEVAGVSGKYWDSCWDDEGRLKKALAEDVDLQDALWTRTEELLEKIA